MSNSEWQKYMKIKYLNLAHAMQKNGRPNIHEPDYFDNSVIINDIKMANELIKACNEYIAEQLKMVEWMVEDDYANLDCTMRFVMNRYEGGRRTMNEELKSCPFCGCDEIEVEHDTHGAFWCYCPACWSRTGTYDQPNGYTLAIDAWNRRANDGASE